MQDRFEEAEILLTQGLRNKPTSGIIAAEETLIEETSRLLMIRALVTNIFRYQRKHNKTQDIHRRIVQIRQNTQGMSHRDILHNMVELADSIRLQDQHEEARQQYEHILMVMETMAEVDEPWAPCMNGLASVLFEIKNYEKAEELQWCIVNEKEKTRGFDHPSVAFSMGTWNYRKDRWALIGEFTLSTVLGNSPDAVYARSGSGSTHHSTARHFKITQGTRRPDYPPNVEFLKHLNRTLRMSDLGYEFRKISRGLREECGTLREQGRHYWNGGRPYENWGGAYEKGGRPYEIRWRPYEIQRPYEIKRTYEVKRRYENRGRPYWNTSRPHEETALN
ncbi:hypothetical protein MMC15_002663 [Xylographa vitiligo]|nr:hypothetical protein [Xylographa vitiligo]